MSEDKEPKKPARRKVELDPKLAAYKGVWVFVEHERGQAHPVSWELMGEGRKLADKLGVELSGIVMGMPSLESRQFCNEAIHYGADRCYLMEDILLEDYRNEPFTKGLTDLVNHYQPEILLIGATTLGRDLAGSVATTLKTGLTADCTELAIDMENRSLAATRPTFGGSLLCTIVTLNYRPQMATVRPRVMAMPEKNGYPDLAVFEGSKPSGLQKFDQCVYVSPVVLRWPWQFVWFSSLLQASSWRHHHPCQPFRRDTVIHHIVHPDRLRLAPALELWTR